MSKTLLKAFDKQGVKTFLNTKCENFRVGKDSVKVDLVEGDKKTEVEAEVRHQRLPPTERTPDHEETSPIAAERTVTARP